ncbi:MAG TPA: phosphatidylglycerophosphatase A [Gallionellaceae bacterium]
MTTSHDQLRFKPDWRFLLNHPAHLLAFGFGSGLSRWAPGTFGTLVAFPIYWYLAPRLSDALFILVLIWAFAFGVWVCDKTGRALGVADYGGIVWDEIVAFLLVLFFTPEGWVWQVAAFLLFRFFDITKPQPIRHFDKTWHGGLGVMFDDILAAGYALLCMALVKSVM